MKKTKKLNSVSSSISKFFMFDKLGATFKKEVIGGLSTFIAMSYILLVNPTILSAANNAQDYKAVFFLGTAISAVLGSLLMGLYAKIPIAMAPGMGVNAFFAYTVASNVLGLQVEQALVATFASGILYLIIAVTPARKFIAKVLPKNVKLAIGAMIGLFLAYIGLSDAGIINSGAIQNFDTKNFPKITAVSLVKTQIGNFKDAFVIIAVVIMILAFVLHFLKVNGAALIAMLAGVAMIGIAYAAGVGDSANAFKLQDYKSFGRFDELSKGMWTALPKAFANGKLYIAIFVFLYIDFFDTSGTLFAVGEQAKLNKAQGEEVWLKKANIADAAGTIIGAVMCVSTNTSYVESSVGVSQGAKTGFASVITAMLFLLSIAAWPILAPIMPIEHVTSSVGVISNYTIMPITGPILVLVGALMLSQLKHFDWEQVIDIPMLFITLMFGLLAFSISTGFSAGIIMYYIINFVTYIVSLIKLKLGKGPLEINTLEMPLAKENMKKRKSQLPDLKKRVLNPVMITLFLLAIAYFATMPLYMY